MAEPIEILHVEDDPDIRMLVDMSLRLDPGLSVVSVGSGEEALSLLDLGVVTPAAVLLDYYIDGMTGVDFIRLLHARQVLGKIPVIFLIAGSDAQDVEQMMAAGARGVLTKPFNPVTLAQELRALLRR